MLLSITLIACSNAKEEVHVHTFAEVWSYNDDYHYYKSSCGHDVYKDLEEHSFTSYILDEKTDKYYRTCTVCGFKQEKSEDSNVNVILEYDENFHYYVNIDTLEKFDLEEHKFSEYVVVKEASPDKEGVKVKKCEICGYEEEEMIEKLEIKKIPKLEKGDTIALIAPASPSSSDSTYLSAKAKLESYGYKVKVYPSVTNGKNYSVSYLGMNLGLVHSVNGTLKNLYPKGLRVHAKIDDSF